MPRSRTAGRGAVIVKGAVRSVVAPCMAVACLNNTIHRREREGRKLNSGRLNGISWQIIGGAVDVHKHVGPGLLESAYEACLAFELTERALAMERRKALPIAYRGVEPDCGYHIDLLVEDAVIVALRQSTGWNPSTKRN